jgi:large subunit ribosomal protein L18
MDRTIKDETKRRRIKRAARIRKKVEGTAERPRLSVFRSSKHIYAQLIDDLSGKTLATASSLSPELKEQLAGLKKSEEAEKVGLRIAEVAKGIGITRATFDRAGYPYHGRVAALAKGARDGGLDF